ncbi:MAG: hypothetical protein V4673_07185 [Pseudomonadota bacterium]
MILKLYFILFVIFSSLQITGFVIARLAYPDAPFDIASGIFNIGIIVLGTAVIFLRAFNKTSWSAGIRKAVFAFLAAAVIYAIYFSVVVGRSHSASGHIPWLLVGLHLFYVPMLFASFRYAWRT